MPGTAYVDRGIKPTGSPTYPLDVLAAFSSDRKKFLISVVNPTEEANSFTPKISGVNLRGRASFIRLRRPVSTQPMKRARSLRSKSSRVRRTGFPRPAGAAL